MRIRLGKLDPKSTGGEGFDFEDKIGAYFLSFLLVGKSPFPSLPLGRFTSVKFQRKVDGWELDDVILSFDLEGLEKQFAFSVKSNSQITANKFPSDLVNLIWTQYCKTDKNPFRSKYDYLGLISSGTSTAATESYRKLRNFASKHKGVDLDIHIKQPEFTNQNVRDLYECFEKPSSLTCNSNILRAEIIERLIHFDINLDDPTSPFLKEAFDNLNSILIKGNGSDLWVKLQHVSKTSRTVSGEVGFTTLIEELKDSFEIKGHYDLESDLQKLNELREVETGKVKSTVGNNFSIERKMDFFQQLKKGQVNAIIGESGVGKSVLLKQWVSKKEMPIIWLPYSIFRARSLPELNTLLGIKNDLFDILKFGPSEQIVIIDAVDRLTSLEDRELLKSFLIKFQSISGSRHSCVVTSQDQIWRTLVGSLSTQEVIFNVISAPLFEEDELKLVEKGLPNLAGILKVGATREILKNPKYLDLAVQMAQGSSLDMSKSISEPVLIRGFWDMLKDGGNSQKQAFLIKLAINQADKSDFLSPLKELSTNEAPLVDILVRDGILKTQDGHIRFSHDLYGDWIRQRFLLSRRENTIIEIVKRKNNVYWQNTIKLASLEILETDGFDNWKREIETLNESGEEVLVDLFLDIAITSLNQRFILETIKGLLFSDNFKVFHRFLERFLAYATAPNPQIMSMREEFELDELTAAQINRVPLYTYWPGLLLFLADNLGNTSKGRFQMSQIAEKWLTFTPNNFPFRKEAAKIAFECAKWVFEFKKSKQGYVKDDADKKCYQALLAAYPELPGEIEDLCLKLVGLREDGIERPAPTVSHSKTKKAPPINTLPMTRRRIEKKVLPYGPQFEKDRVFKDVCLVGQSFSFLVQANSSLASQVLLASIIDDPQEFEDLYDDGWRMDERLGTEYTQEFYPPLYTKGPFLNFFRVAPQQAVETLISLISLVTDQWAERQTKRGNEIFGFDVEISGVNKYWRGDAQVFSWAMDTAHCPDIVVTFLMALEKWLYEQIDAKEDITPWVDQIVNKSDSLALLGVLVSVAKYSPKLFLEKLQFLLALPYVIWWDQQFLLQNHSGTVSMISWSGRDQYVTNLALKWFGMDHRKTSIEQWAIYFLLNVSSMKDFFATSRISWEKELGEQSDPQFEALICKFNPDNYKLGKLPDGTQVWNYTAPTIFIEKYKERFEDNDARMSLLMFPMNVNNLLDANSFSKEEFRALESAVEKIKNAIKDKDGDPLLTTPIDCELAIDGMRLLADKDQIITIDNKKLLAARKNIEKALQNLWTDPGVVGYPYDLSGQKYDVILAKVIGQLAEGKKEDVWIRTQIAYIVCGPRSNAITALVKSAVSSNVENKFILEVLSLVFNLSKIRTAWHDVDRSEKYSYDRKKSNFAKSFLCKNNFFRKKVFRSYTLEDRKCIFENEVSILVDSFINSSVKDGWPNWEFSPDSYKFTHGIELPSFERGIIHLDSFTQAASCLPEIEHWDDDLKQGWLDFISTGLDNISKRLSKSIKDNNEVKGTPYQQDRWVINTFAITYYWHEGIGLDQSLKSFFEIGESGHYWLDDFGKNLFRLGLKKTDRWKHLVSKLDKIFDLALSVKQLQSEHRSWDADEIWCSLVGLDDIIIQFIPVEAKPLITDLLSIYERLLKTRSGSDKCLSRFISLLCKDAAMGIRIKGLELVAIELKDINFSDYWQRHYISTYSYFLTILWRENQHDLKSNKDALANFQQILNGLISVQDPAALELASLINTTRL